MKPFTAVTGRAYPLDRNNVDTDLIIPAHYLKTVSRTGLGSGAFETIRATPGNVFDNPAFAEAPILLSGANFGCGSSREHAAWAIGDMGISVIIAPSFSDIFAGNAFKNGILAVVLPQGVVDRLMGIADTHPISVDLANQTVTTPLQDRFPFEMDSFQRHCLLNGLDEIGLTLAMHDMVVAHEGRTADQWPWLG